MSVYYFKPKPTKVKKKVDFVMFEYHRNTEPSGDAAAFPFSISGSSYHVKCLHLSSVFMHFIVRFEGTKHHKPSEGVRVV